MKKLIIIKNHIMRAYISKEYMNKDFEAFRKILRRLKNYLLHIFPYGKNLFINLITLPFYSLSGIIVLTNNENTCIITVREYFICR